LSEIPPTLVAMARSIEFDADQLIGKLNILQKVQLPYAGNQALKELGFKMRGELAQYMAEVFDNPVPFTLRSPRYAIDGLTLTVSISKDGAKVRILLATCTPSAPMTAVVQSLRTSRASPRQ